jgi:hypothetical protein
MLLQGDLPKGFLEGKEEAECFSKREFIRMNESTNTKVHFFRHVIDLAIRGKLKTAGQSIANASINCSKAALPASWHSLAPFSAC